MSIKFPNLLLRNLVSNSKVDHKNPKEVLESIAGVEKEISKLLGEIKKDL